MNSIVVGLGFGDEGKGTIVDYLTRRDNARLVVRFNGGPQAAHNVVVNGGPHHCFSQWGSGTLAGADTFLSRFTLISVGALIEEERALIKIGVEHPASHLIIDSEAIVITPFHVALNRLRELARDSRHGSCGRGVGEAVSDDLLRPELTVRVSDLENLDLLSGKLRRLQAYKIENFAAQLAPLKVWTRDSSDNVDLLYDCKTDFARITHDALFELKERGLRVVHSSWLSTAPGPIIFEGAQGVLLDQDFGFHPHTTWSKTTFDNALSLSRDAELKDPVQKIGVLRTFHTRHGHGPFPTDDLIMRPSANEHNTFQRWQGIFRCGAFDATLARYALSVTGSVSLALTHCDLVEQPRAIVRVSPRYEDEIDMQPGNLERQEELGQQLFRAVPVINRLVPIADAFIDWVEQQLNTRVGIVSHGPSGENKNEFVKR